MAKSPTSDKGSLLAVIIKIEGKEMEDKYDMRSVYVETALNKIPMARLEIYDGDFTKQNFEGSESGTFDPGKEVEILAGHSTDKQASIFKGVIMEHGVALGARGGLTMTLYCYDPAISLTQGSKNRIFEKKKDSEAFSTIAGDHKGVSITCKATTVKHPMLVQYFSTDWDFILSRADANGYVAVIEEGKVDLGPPKTSESATVKVMLAKDLYDFDLRVNALFQADKAKAQAWSYADQKLVSGASAKPAEDAAGDLKGTKLKSVVNTKDYLLSSSAPLTEAELKAWASGVIQRQALSRLQGRITFTGTDKVKTGGTIELAGLGKHLNGVAYVAGIRHDLRSGSWRTTALLGLPPETHSQRHPQLSAPRASGLLPAVSGLHQGVVMKIDADPDGEARVQVAIATLDKDEVGIWARMTHYYATKKGGFFFMPEVGDEVILGFLNDDPRYPVILGSLYSSKIAPQYEADAKNETKAIVTNSELKIEFDEKKKQILIETPGGNSLTICDDDKKVEIADANSNTFTLDSKGITLESGKDITLKAAKGKIAMEAMNGVEIKAKAGDLKAEALNVALKGKIGFKAEGVQAELSGSAMTTIKGGLVKIN